MTIEFPWIEPGEQVLWSGKPNPLRYAWKRGWGSLVASIVFLAMAAFFIDSVFVVSKVNFPLSMWLFQVVGSVFVTGLGLFLLFFPAWLGVRASRTKYALTNRRAVIDIAPPLMRRISVPLGQISFVEVWPRPNGNGDVVFREVIHNGAEGLGPRRDGFIGIRDATQVEQIIRRAIDDLPAARLREIS